MKIADKIFLAKSRQLSEEIYKRLDLLVTMFKKFEEKLSGLNKDTLDILKKLESLESRIINLESKSSI